ncbi:type I-C CRISPR-associated protein Cas8c/Csd1 [Chelonobacter oris]|uniref:type I-C CRISPR-associated protein Cas8c/Csd1 n=1 Tax=Chelonobacter oris TaxID=505317 RepID=UPI00244CE77F|nr:type I-C CRISPR-associated protein Cas8c/Csd1 [Chelonobacter oris]MDH2999901.1 type I-C CRISPR-associated protein Cas8c/Csd1 [Chelonobacter oris]
MSWVQKLYKTYDAILAKNLADEMQPLTPVGHTLQTAHITIVLDGEGNFQAAKVMPPKTTLMLPVTEASENRTSGEAPHPLADKIQYVAKDYPDYGGDKKAYFEGYLQQLQDWCDSPFAHPKVKVVLNYVKKGRLVSDLVKTGIFKLDSNNCVLNKWEGEGEAAPIFATLPKGQEYGSALVCWSVEIDGDVQSETWRDKTVQQSWIDYISDSQTAQDFCMVQGENAVISNMHPAKLRHTGDKAKLISSNDSNGYTFRGRFEEAQQAASMSAEVSAKAHSALRWLIARQGFRNGEQVSVAWAISGKAVPSPLQDNYDFLDDDEDELALISEQAESNPPPETLISQLDWSNDMGGKAAELIKKKLQGYKSELKAHEQISLLMLDSATPGRMALTYYQEFLPADYFKNLNAWIDDFSWYQRHSKEIKEGKKSIKHTVWPYLPPSPYAVFEAIYGKVSDKDGKLKKQLYARLLPVIAGGKNVPIPLDLVQQSFQTACRPNSYEHWEWERNVGVACALYKGYHARHHDLSQRRNYPMALDKENRSRDYLYGRLLAIAENIESYALYLAEEKRATTAERYMQRFAEHPFATWRNIELALVPYQDRLRGRQKDTGKQAIGEIMELFAGEDFTCDNRLSGEFLLGYHCQKMEFARQIAERKAAKAAKQNNPQTSN